MRFSNRVFRVAVPRMNFSRRVFRCGELGDISLMLMCTKQTGFYLILSYSHQESVRTFYLGTLSQGQFN